MILLSVLAVGMAAVAPVSPADLRYWGPHATITAAGDVAETAEVAAAKAELARAYNAALTQTVFVPAVPAAPAKWYGPAAATIPAGLPGAGPNVAETAEVAAASAAFQQAYSAALAATTGQIV